ncbi:hypothetical protein KJ885_02580 [Patescibacteria group bacterium]|nr:hypothetical protein [Patescibacteria group bacterium]
MEKWRGKNKIKDRKGFATSPHRASCRIIGVIPAEKKGRRAIYLEKGGKR